jgi:hypothetical protein
MTKSEENIKLKLENSQLKLQITAMQGMLGDASNRELQLRSNLIVQNLKSKAVDSTQPVTN